MQPEPRMLRRWLKLPTMHPEIRNRWWRDYYAECGAWARALPDTGQRVLVRALTEDGIEVRVRLRTTQPVVYGVFTIDRAK